MISFKKIKNNIKQLKIFHLLTFLSAIPILFLGIGYAQITGSLGLSGFATATPPESVFILLQARAESAPCGGA